MIDLCNVLLTVHLYVDELTKKKNKIKTKQTKTNKQKNHRRIKCTHAFQIITFIKLMHIHTFSCMHVYELRKYVHVLVYFTNIFSPKKIYNDMFNTNAFFDFGFFFWA